MKGKKQTLSFSSICRKPCKVVSLLILLILFTLGCKYFGDSAVVENKIIRVACLGDSITFGYGLQDRNIQSYPSQLAVILGQSWKVENFGVNGATMLRKGKRPYYQQQQYQELIRYSPEFVVILLGTNDIQPTIWQHKNSFVSHYCQLIEEILGKTDVQEIWLCYPPPIFFETAAVKPNMIPDEVIPLIDTVSRTSKKPIIDLYYPLLNKTALFPDKVHPNEHGARLIALLIADTLKEKIKR